MIQTSAMTEIAEKLPMSMSQVLSGFPSEWREVWLQTPLPAFSLISTTSLTDEVLRVLRELESNGVSLKDKANVHEYLLLFPGLIDVLQEAVKSVRKHLGGCQLIVEVYRDPEIEDHYLKLCVRLKGYDESVLERLEAAEAEFIDRLVHVEGWLQVTTDFKEPEDAL